IIDRSPLRIFVVHAQVVVKNAMKADIAKSCGFPHHFKIAAIVFPQGEDCAARAEHLFPEVRKSPGWCVRVELNSLRVNVRRRRGAGRRQQSCPECHEKESAPLIQHKTTPRPPFGVADSSAAAYRLKN